MNDLARIEQALAFIPAVDRDTWVKMGMAVKSELGEDGFPIWDHWSQQDTSYDEKAARDVWKSIRVNGKVTGATLFYEAKRHGWQHDGTFTEALTDQERAERDRERQDALRQVEEDQAKRNQEAANKTGLLWSHAKPIVPGHPYLLRKHVEPTTTLKEIGANQATMILGYAPKLNGELLVGRLLVVPIKVGDTFTTVELIDEAGRKSALAGGAKKGGYWSAQSLPNGDGEGSTLLIAEGVATGLSGKDATGYLAIAALSAGNLTAVAKAMRERYPAATLIVLADLTKDTGKSNAKAIDAAEAVNGLLAIPDFGQDRPEGMTDFNDLAVLRGLDNGMVAPFLKRHWSATVDKQCST